MFKRSVLDEHVVDDGGDDGENHDSGGKFEGLGEQGQEQKSDNGADNKAPQGLVAVVVGIDAFTLSQPGFRGGGNIRGMALPLDAAERKIPPTDPDMVVKANARLEKILTAEAGENKNSEWALKAYKSVKTLLDSGAFNDDPLVKRAAELYVQGIEYLAPKAPGVGATVATVLTLRPMA